MRIMQAGKLLILIKKLIKNKKLINKENVSRFLFHLKQGNLREALRKILRKVNSLEVQRGIFFLNDNLYQQENIQYDYDGTSATKI